MQVETCIPVFLSVFFITHLFMRNQFIIRFIIPLFSILSGLDILKAQSIPDREFSVGVKIGGGASALTSPVVLTDLIYSSGFFNLFGGGYFILPLGSRWLAFQPELYFSLRSLPNESPRIGGSVLQTLELPLLLNQVISYGGRTPVGFGQAESITTYTTYGPTLNYTFAASEFLVDNGVRNEKPLIGIRNFNVGFAASYGFEMHYGKSSINTELRVYLNFLPFKTFSTEVARLYGINFILGYTFGQ
jgi:hypothetical protein